MQEHCIIFMKNQTHLGKLFLPSHRALAPQKSSPPHVLPPLEGSMPSKKLAQGPIRSHLNGNYLLELFLNNLKKRP